LVPLRRGLFEIRVLAGDSLTGLREALLVDRTIASLGDGEVPALSQAEIDDPAHDAAVPQHALSRVRAALGRARDLGLPRVSEPAVPIAGERALNSPSLFEDILAAVRDGDVQAARLANLHDDLRRLEELVRELRPAERDSFGDVIQPEQQAEVSTRDDRMRERNEQFERDLSELERRQQRRLATGSRQRSKRQPN
jgi:hypothetical protein